MRNDYDCKGSEWRRDGLYQNDTKYPLKCIKMIQNAAIGGKVLQCYNVTPEKSRRGSFIIYIYYINILPLYPPKSGEFFVAKTGWIFGKRGQKTEKTERKCVIVRKRGYKDNRDVTM